MNRLFFVAYYTRWHYGKGLRELFRNWMDFLWFVVEFFSLGILVKTLFSPWERMGEGYPAGFHPSEMIQTFIVNSLMRLVGFCVRIVVLCVGFIALIFSLVFGVVLMVSWLLFPGIIFFLLALALRYSTV